MRVEENARRGGDNNVPKGVTSGKETVKDGVRSPCEGGGEWVGGVVSGRGRDVEDREGGVEEEDVWSVWRG